MTADAFPVILQLAAFADGPGGGNVAGVILDAAGLDEAQMQETARRLGHSETAFVTTPVDAQRRATIRYFSPGAEVPFCGHATVATAVALAQRHGPGTFELMTLAGEIVVATQATEHGMLASFTSVEPAVTEIAPAVLKRLLSLLALRPDSLDPAYPPRLAAAGNTHPVLVMANQEEFNSFNFDAPALRLLMDEQGWAGTVTVLWAASAAEFQARNLFPVGDIREDPATGSAAAATGAYLRALGAVELPATVLIRQGRHVGRPSLLTVVIPATGGIKVSGTASHIS